MLVSQRIFGDQSNTENCEAVRESNYIYENYLAG
jgi:hypothetical protein